MPSYDWVCETCQKHETMIVSIKESDTPPEEKSSDSCTAHVWKKVILGAPQKAYGPSWGWSKKGSW